MDIAELERNLKIGLYDMHPDLIGNSGKFDPEDPKVKKKMLELRSRLREDCVLAAISAGVTRAQARRMYDTVDEVAGPEGPANVVKLMIGMIRAHL